jgi:hypothetical protein
LAIHVTDVVHLLQMREKSMKVSLLQIELNTRFWHMRQQSIKVPLFAVSLRFISAYNTSLDKFVNQQVGLKRASPLLLRASF